MKLTRLFAPLALLLTACSGTGQPERSYPAYAVVAPAGEIAAGAWTVTLSEATVAFGPVYFCAAASGSATLCEAAIAELPAIALVDGLESQPQPLGRVEGYEGDIRSASYDYGIHWFLTEAGPTADPSAPGGHSARLVGEARRGEQVVPFSAEIDVLAQFKGQRSVPSAPVSAHVRGDGVRLEIRFDVGAWLAEIDWDSALESGGGTYAIEPGSRDHNAVVVSMVSTHPPQFVWSGADVEAAR